MKKYISASLLILSVFISSSFAQTAKTPQATTNASAAVKSKQPTQGIEIPFEARILAVADSFDAMTSTRPYREGMSIEKASQILQASAGIQWDARVVDAFFACRDKIVEACHQANNAIQGGSNHDDNIARAVLSIRTG